MAMSARRLPEPSWRLSTHEIAADVEHRDGERQQPGFGAGLQRLVDDGLGGLERQARLQAMDVIVGHRRVELDALNRERHALADADAHGRERAPAAGFHHLMRRRDGKPRARHAERMAERDRAAVRIDVLGVVRHAELAQAGEGLRGERLVELDHVEVADLAAERSMSLRVDGTGPMPMMRGGTPADAMPTMRA